MQKSKRGIGHPFIYLPQNGDVSLLGSVRLQRRCDRVQHQHPGWKLIQEIGKASCFCEAVLVMQENTTAELIGELNYTGVQFLLTDAQVAHTLLNLAENSGAEDRVRRIDEAQRAYETIVHLLTRLHPDATERLELSDSLNRLPERLAIFGGKTD